MTRYRTIVSDPPWPYPEGFASSVEDNRASGSRNGAVVKELPYSSMPLEEIAALSVADLADPDGCVLFLWTTSRYIQDSFGIAEAWGFRYRQLLVWDKGTSASPFGGAVTHNRAEFLLVCSVGQPRLKRWAGGSVIHANKGSQPGTHSQKPEKFLDMVEQVSIGPYLEMFARRNRLGWDTWGNECFEHVDLGGTA